MQPVPSGPAALPPCKEPPLPCANIAENLICWYTHAVVSGKIMAYSAPAFALAVVGIPVYIYIPKFLTDVVGVHISVLGAILLIARLFEAFTGPVIGLVSDRLDTLMGRRTDALFITRAASKNHCKGDRGFPQKSFNHRLCNGWDHT